MDYHSSFVLMMRIPARRSLCPLEYLVLIQPNPLMYPSTIREGMLTTIFTPHLNGSCKGGGPNVMSTINFPPTPWTLSA